MDFLDRDSAPLSAEEWARLDSAVVAAAKKTLVGRRVVELLGPLGAGVYNLPYSVFSGKTPTGIDMVGDEGDFVVKAASRRTINLPMLYKDFKMFWRDVETDRQLGLPMDVSTASVAAEYVAVQEDQLIFNGNDALGQEGLFTAKGRQTVSGGDWNEQGNALADVVEAVSALSQAGFYGPYSLAVSPLLYGKMVRVYGNTGMLELDQVKALVTGGVYYSNVITGSKAVLLATGAQNVSLAVGQDFTTAYMGSANMNHEFRVMETAALAIRRPDSICTIE